MTGTPAFPAALMAGVSATLSTGSTMIAFTPWRTICWIAEICCSAVDAAMVAGMLVTRLPVTRPAAGTGAGRGRRRGRRRAGRGERRDQHHAGQAGSYLSDPGSEPVLSMVHRFTPHSRLAWVAVFG